MSSSGTEAGPLRSELRGRALVLVLDREQAGNSLSLDLIAALSQALEANWNRTDIAGLVLTGAGSKFFCTGGDVKAYRAIRDVTGLEQAFGAARHLLRQIEDFPLPVVAAINGYALGGGVELALACDLRFATSSAQLGLPQVKLGIIPGWNGTERLVRTVGRSRALRLLLTGQRLTSAEALALGLIDGLESDSVAAAVAFLNELDGAPLAIQGVKAAVRATDGSCPDISATTEAILERLWFTEDHREAEAAFAEKRSPHFHGS